VRQRDGTLLVATTAPVAQKGYIHPLELRRVAATIETAIMERPRDAVPRFIASPGWGGQP
jgi:hypothetical protein